VRINASDPGGADDPLTYEWDFDNDGVYEVTSQANVAQHTFPDNGLYTVNVRVRDSHGAEATSSIGVDVANAAPNYSPPELSDRAPGGTPYPVTVHATDPAGAHDTLTYEFDFDDDGVFEVTSTTGTVQHTYADDGTYFVRIRVRDEDGGVTDVAVVVRD